MSLYIIMNTKRQTAHKTNSKCGEEMQKLIYVDTEIDPVSRRLLDIGCVSDQGGRYHGSSIPEFLRFAAGADFVCGHNILYHDLKYIGSLLQDAGISPSCAMDTLHLSPLLFPAKPYHALLKDDKLQSGDPSNPLTDAVKARELFLDEVSAFRRLDSELQRIYALLLKDHPNFSAFIRFLDVEGGTEAVLPDRIRARFRGMICEAAPLEAMADKKPAELAYALALIYAHSRYSITPPWVLKQYPAVEQVLYGLRSSPCLSGCGYCREALDIHRGLKRFFGFDAFRRFGGKPLQEQAAGAAVAGKSLLAVFPTGGGKSITFQLPALMSGASVKGLTVVISPLQSLMKDQVDNLEQAGITEAVTINGLLDPIERAKSFERVENGTASLLYIAPESLRSKTIERLLLGRNVVRFVVDEAHCFSAWGQDFRVDYLYIGEFIRSLQEKKGLEEGIPVSCFTATAKPRVIEDIQTYFREKLSLDLLLFRSDVSRENLTYQVLHRAGDEEKYNTVRVLLQEKPCPTIVYVSRTRRAYRLAQRLTRDGYPAKPYHGRMDKQEKTENQDAFIRGEVGIMVATSAFGMGVDKKDVGRVIHYEISDSLESYLQEAGRAGRDASLQADCYVLYDDEDLNKHFILLNQTKMSMKEIQQIWKAIKDITRFRANVSQSALEIARKAGWDENVSEIETRVRTAITALEEAGYIKRGQNMPRVYANSILTRSAAEAIFKIHASDAFAERQKEQASRIMQKLFSSRSRKPVDGDTGECRVDYLSDCLGIAREEVVRIIHLLREERILADAKDLTAFIKRTENANRSLGIVQFYQTLERFLAGVIEQEETLYGLKDLNEQAAAAGCTGVTPGHIKRVFNFWAIQNWIKRTLSPNAGQHIGVLCLLDKETLSAKLEQRQDITRFILEFLFEKSVLEFGSKDRNQTELPVEFSVLELKEEYGHRKRMFGLTAKTEEIEDALFYLSRMEALKLEGGFLVVYNGMSIQRLEMDTRRRYKTEDYQKLEQFYQNKIQQIHIVGEYARIMLKDYQEALQFADDYFKLNYPAFLHKYFKGSRLDELLRNITPAKFQQLFGELSPAQLRIIKDQENKTLVVAAGPGSGKTRVLVHKLASLLLLEDVKHEQLLMLTFSRAAAAEFKQRLMRLIGNAARFIEIKTFHSYCFDLLGRVGTLEKSGEILREAVIKIKEGAVEPGRITKTVLVIDEAQDMDSDEFALICALMEHNEDMRVMAVGDDDQNIFAFRGASAQYMTALLTQHGGVLHELLENYRSKAGLVHFTNGWVVRLSQRLKKTPIRPMQQDSGTIRVVRHPDTPLLLPFVEDIAGTKLAGLNGVLVKTNEEALQAASLLAQKGLPVRLIQSNEGFNLSSLAEIRFFMTSLNPSAQVYTLSEEDWSRAKRTLADRYGRSANYETCRSLIQAFEKSHPDRRFRSDLEVFIRESRLEDYIGTSTETLLVSTMHKAKGREFDQVFLLLDQFQLNDEDDIRLLYVAMTRAKSSLIIHYNGHYLESLKAPGLERRFDPDPYPQPDKLVLDLSHRDVWLSSFQHCQCHVEHLLSGDDLLADREGCMTVEGRRVVRFSKHCMERLEVLYNKGYAMEAAKVRFIVHWKSEEAAVEIKILLPTLILEKKRS